MGISPNALRILFVRGITLVRLIHAGSRHGEVYDKKSCKIYVK